MRECHSHTFLSFPRKRESMDLRSSRGMTSKGMSFRFQKRNVVLFFYLSFPFLSVIPIPLCHSRESGNLWIPRLNRGMTDKRTSFPFPIVIPALLCHSRESGNLWIPRSSRGMTNERMSFPHFSVIPAKALSPT